MFNSFVFLGEMAQLAFPPGEADFFLKYGLLPVKLYHKTL